MSSNRLILTGILICVLGIAVNTVLGFPALFIAVILGFIILGFSLFDYPLPTLLVVLGVRVILDKFSDNGISLGGITVNLSGALALAVIAGTALYLLVKHTFPKTTGAFFLYAAFVAFGFLTIPRALNSVEAFGDSIRFLSYAGIFALAATIVKNRERYQTFIALFPFILLIPIGFAAVQMVAGGNGIAFSSIKPVGTFFHPNYFGYASLIALSAIVILWFEFPLLSSQKLKLFVSRFRAIYLAFAVILLYFVFASGSLGARVALLLAAITLLLVTWKRLLVIIPLAFFFASLLFPWYNFALQRQGYPVLENRTFRAVIGESEEDGSFAWRVRMWESMFGFIAEQPLAGWGLGSYKPLRETKFEFFTDLNATEAHNDYMNFLVDTGALGLSLFVLFFLWISALFYLFTIRNRSQNNSSLVLFSLLLAIMTSMGVENIFKGASIMWPLFALIGATIPTNKKQLTVNNKTG